MKKVFLLLFLCLLSCSDNKVSDQEIVVGMSMDFPPFESLKDGKPVGFEVDLVNEIGLVLNKKIKLVDIDFGGIIGSINAGRVDIGASGITVTEERKKNVDFVSCYYYPKLTVIYPKSAAKIGAAKDLAGKIIGVQTSTTMENALKELQKTFPSIKIRSLPKNTYLLQELKTKKLDGLMLEQGQAAVFAKQNDANFDYAVVGRNDGECYSMAFKTGSPLKQEVEKALITLRKNGKVAELEAKWL